MESSNKRTPVHPGTIPSGCGGGTRSFIWTLPSKPSISPNKHRRHPAEREKSPDSRRSSAGKQTKANFLLRSDTVSTIFLQNLSSRGENQHAEEWRGTLLNFWLRLIYSFLFFVFVFFLQNEHMRCINGERPLLTIINNFHRGKNLTKH